VDNKGNKQWVWLALDADTREIVGVYIGARDETAAGQLWNSLPGVYRQCAIAYTDFWAAYATVVPSKRHRAVGKQTGKTSLVERLNNTLRQRVSRLVRKTLSNSCVPGESHWCYLVFRPLLQCIITYLALPRDGRASLDVTACFSPLLLWILSLWPESRKTFSTGGRCIDPEYKIYGVGN